MPLKTYSQLKQGLEDCIYRAFENITRETKDQMGQRINAAGYDADDSQGVVVLADAYGLDIYEAFHAADFMSQNYRLESNKDYILICTGEIKPRAAIRAWNHADGMLTTREARDILMNESYDSVNWHAIYASTDANGNPVFSDPQGRYSNGPNGQSVAIAICGAPRV